MLGQIAGEEVAPCCAHIAQEVDEAGGCGRRAAPGQIHGQGADQQHLRSEDAKTDEEQDRDGGGEAPMNERVVGQREAAEQTEQQANHGGPPTAKELVGEPAANVSAGDAAQREHGVFEGGGTHAGALHLL